MKSRIGIMGKILFACLLSFSAAASPSFQQVGNTLVMSNADVVLQYNLNAGTTDFYWQNAKKISSFYSGVGLSSGYVKGVSYSHWSYMVTASNQVVVIATGSGLPTMEQFFTLDQTDSFLVSVSVVGTNLSANWMGPVVVDTTGWVRLGVTNDNRALVVPFDNDGFVSYNAESINNSATGYEVGAFYDNTSRNGLVVGSVTHDTWKTGVFFSGANNQLSLLNVFGGATSPWDAMPHGSVTGNTITSPTVFVGFGADWRTTMQNFATENTNFTARLTWTNGLPFGWNSWGIIQTNLSYSNALAVSEYFYNNLMRSNFNDNGTVYINLDSYWNNLSAPQLQQFTFQCHARGEKAGIYLGPFTYWGTAAQGSNSLITGSSTYYWSDTYLRTASGAVQTLDGGIALDPTHPGTQQMISYYINEYISWGFDYVKVDFLSHGTLEGIHYNASVTTGIQAYNEGMQYLLNAVGGRMFISESIAPLFPYQYGHSRRIACDAETSLIANTAYTMNSVSYGWWLDNLYQFNDPDVMVFNGYGATTNENQSRLISGAVTGVFLDGDDLSTSSGQSAASTMLTNALIDSVARAGQTFTPVEGNTGTGAVSLFVRQSGATWYIAVFNYTANSTNEMVGLSRVGLPSATYNVVNLLDGTTTAVSNGVMNVNLNAAQSKLFQLSAYASSGLRWSGTNNNGVWNTDLSTNWIDVTNNFPTVFNAGDGVLFDDTPGAPTSVTVNGTVLPGLVAINSSTNNFTFDGAGDLSGSAALVKEGSSTLTILSPAGFTGPVSIEGGTIYAGDYSFSQVSSIVITNNATLDFGGGPLAGIPVTVSGAGVSNEGALYNSSYPVYASSGAQVLNITLAGDTTFGAASGGGSRWDLADGSMLSGPCKVTINFPDGYGEWDTVAMAANVGDLELVQGSWGLKGMGASLGNPANTLTVDSGTALDFWTGAGGTTSGYNKIIHVLANGTNQILTGFTNFNANMILENGATFSENYGSGNQFLNGTFLLNGVAHFETQDANLIFTNVMSGSGGFVWDEYDHEIIFQAANTYTGPTVIGGGLTLALSNNGSIAKSALIFLGGSNSANNSLDVSGRSDRTLTLASGQTLAGVGGINGSLVVSPGAIISPGGTNTELGITTGANSIGIIEAANSIQLQGTTTMKLNGSGANDSVQSSGGTITYGGTLNLINISSSPLAAGNSFQLFSAGDYSGSFGNIFPPAPGTGLAWDLSQLNGGILNVVAVPSPPIINSVTLSGGKLIFQGSNGAAGQDFFVLMTTDLSTPLTNWFRLSTNVFNAGGAFSFSNAVDPGTPQEYYLIATPE